MYNEFKPKFVKRFGELRKPIADAANAFAREVREGTFPDTEHSF